MHVRLPIIRIISSASRRPVAAQLSVLSYKPPATRFAFASLTRTMASNPQSGTEKEPQSASASASGTGTGTGTGATPTPSFASINIKNNTINEAEGVKLSEHQKVLVGSTLDIFEGNPTLKHFSLWSPTATFDDPLTKAEGEAHYKAQWYGLVSLFHPIRIQSHRVTSSKNPIEFELSNKYTVRGIGKEQVIDSVVSIHVGEDGKIERLVDRWGGRLPEGAVVDTFRKLNAVTVPMFVTVPKTEEEDMKLKAARDKENARSATSSV